MRNLEQLAGNELGVSNIESFLSRRCKSSFEFGQNMSKVLEQLKKLSGDERNRAEEVIEQHLRKIAPDVDFNLRPGDEPGFSSTVMLVESFEGNRKNALLQDKDYRAKFLNMYHLNDRYTRNGGVSDHGDLIADEDLPELTGTEEFRNWYKTTLLGDIKDYKEQLERNDSSGYQYQFFEDTLGRLSKKYIDEEFVARTEVQQYIKDSIEEELNSNLQDSRDYRPFFALRRLKEVKDRGYIKDDYFSSEEFQSKLLSAFEEWLNNFYLHLKKDASEQFRADKIKDIKSFMGLVSEFIDDKTALTAILEKSIKEHQNNDLYDVNEVEKNELLNQFLAELK